MDLMTGLTIAITVLTAFAVVVAILQFKKNEAPKLTAESKNSSENTQNENVDQRQQTAGDNAIQVQSDGDADVKK